jgi:hypothetical protein
MKKFATIAGLMVAIVLGKPAHAANLIVNGDFSTPNEGGGWSIGPVPGWTDLNDTGVEVGASSIYGLPSISTNGQNLEVNANTWGDVVQTVNGLTPGQTYTLSWEYGGRTSGGPDQLIVNFGGSQVTVDSGSVGYWTLNSFNVTATSASETLEFLSVNTGNLGGLPSYGNEVTNVSLIAAPGPNVGEGLLGFAAMSALLIAARYRGLIV